MSDKTLRIALVLTAMDKASTVVAKSFAKMEHGAKMMKNSAKAISETGDKAALAGGILTAFFGKTVQDARESIIAQKKLEQGFVSMGMSAKRAVDAVDFAGRMQFDIGVEDEQIEDVQGKLSGFKNTLTKTAEAHNVFNRAVQSSFDLQAKGFGDAMVNITKIGAALNNPALAASGLKKMAGFNKKDVEGVAFIQKTKGIAAAQEYLLTALERKAKGSAKIMADPVKQADLQTKEMSESIGKILLPEVNKLAAAFVEFAPKVFVFIDSHKDLILTVGKAAVALLGFGVAMKGVSLVVSGMGTAMTVAGGIMNGAQFVGGMMGFGSKALAAGESLGKFQSAGLAVSNTFKVIGTTLMANPILIIIAAIAVAAYLIYNNWDGIKAWFTALWAKVKVAFSAAWEWIKNMFLDYTPAGLIIKHWDSIKSWFTNLWASVKSGINSAWEGIKSIFLNYTPYGLVIKHWDKISAMFTGVWDGVKKVFTGVVDWTMGLGAQFLEAGKNIVKSIGNGIMAMASYPIDAIKGIVGKIRDHLPFSPAKIGPLKDIHRIRLVETIAQSINAKPLINAWQNVTGQLYGKMNQPMTVPSGGGGNNSHTHFEINITLNGGATAADGDMLGNRLKKDLDKWWNDKQRQDIRTGF